MNNNQYVTSPNLPAEEGMVHTGKELSDAMTLDLNDDEIKVAVRMVNMIRGKYAGKTFDTIEQGMLIVEEMEKEMQSILAEQIGVLCRVDVTPMLMGEPPILEIMGKLPGTSIDKYGFDHEKKQYEVRLATQRGEDFLGQKGEVNATKAKKRAKRK